ncbi:hypothetical protein O3G_MSEX000149 [Manduca sexta]|nr:hypothetical protein O3G_MSEX000149 [Manduca sexta]
MHFSRVFAFVLVFCSRAISCDRSARAEMEGFQEDFGQNIRDGIIKAGPAVAVVGQAASIYKGK